MIALKDIAHRIFCAGQTPDLPTLAFLLEYATKDNDEETKKQVGGVIDRAKIRFGPSQFEEYQRLKRRYDFP